MLGTIICNTLILLTSNVGTDVIMRLCRAPDAMPDVDEMNKALRQPLLEVFPPALIRRLVTIPYYPLSDDILQTIIRLKLNKIVNIVAENHAVEMTYDDAVVDLIAERCQDVDSGARVVDSILTNAVLPKVSREFLEYMLARRKKISTVKITITEGEFNYKFH